MINPNTPILVGTAQVLHRAEGTDDLIEPLDMMLEACVRAEQDAGVDSLLEQVQSIRVIRGIWNYDNPGKYIAEKIGATGAQTTGTLFGGNYVQYVVNHTAEEIRTPTAGNRRISFPYTKLMNANVVVDMGAALIMCSVDKARKLGIPEHLWVYPHAGVEGNDHFSASVRENFHSSPAIRLVGERVLELADTRVDDLAFVDLYSCFPSAVQIAANELGLNETRPLTVTGGLTFGGGPLNNYVMHSISRMVELMRADPGKKGLITANGGNLYKHAHCIYSGEPPARDFRHDNVQARIDALPSKENIADYEGEAVIESWTVMFAGDDPAIGHCACLTPDGKRTWVNTDEREMMAAMISEEFRGRPVTIKAGALHLR